MNIAVLGSGAWGTALASAWADHPQHCVTLWGREAEVINALRAQSAEHRINHRYLPGVTLSSQLMLSSDWLHVMAAHQGVDDLLIIATPIAGLREIAQRIAQSGSQAAVVWLCKGVERETLQFPHQVVGSVLSASTAFGVLSGPSFAQEVARGLPCAMVLASQSHRLSLNIVQQLSSPTLRLYHSQDVVGVELGGAHKNVLAIAAGISDGLSLGMNARAALLTRGIAEMRRFAHALGANPDTISGLTGVGDLILTATGDLSRNRSVGLQLAQGKALADITAELGHVAEGAMCAHAMLQIAQLHHINAPITEGVCAILAGTPPQAVLSQLLLREVGRE